MLSTYLANFVDLIFPRLCQACRANLLGTEQLICTRCLFDLPYTHFAGQPNNIVAQQFWGKVSLQMAYALLYFEKGGSVQHLMHQFKYQDMPAIGNLLGRIAGEQLLQNSFARHVDCIIPVPLHKGRLRERGYNQSTCFARGLSEKLAVPVIEHNLIRQAKTSTQTRKSRFDRYQNMRQVFAVTNPEALAGRHILLVDDIITTGSTLEACAHELLNIPSVKLSIAAMAYAT
jgi:ComF family protein